MVRFYKKSKVLLALALLLLAFVVPMSFSNVASAAFQPVDETAIKDNVSGGDCSSINNCGIIDKYINPAINVMSVIFGIIVVISIVIGGIQYSSSAGDPAKVTAAKKRISNAILSLVAFMLLYAIIDFFLPGGLINKSTTTSTSTSTTPTPTTGTP